MNRAERDGCRAWQLLMKFFFAQRRHLPSYGTPLDLSPVQCHALHLIEPGRPLPMSRLADTLSCDASNVTGLIDRLESKGLIRRQPSPQDRRLKVLDLTPAGARLRTVVLERITNPPETLKRLPPAEQEWLVKILRHLLEGKI